ncbi:MAG: hypothetical protein DCC58_18490 [Chloroflexi bacterium]|nr:MAG: hypothetical protein DCC58_18490 [Chloroflexota bacterium]
MVGQDVIATLQRGFGERRFSRRALLRYGAGVGCTVALLPVLAACGGDDDDDAAPTATTGSGGSGGATVDVTLSDFKVAVNPASVAAGSVTFNVKNNGAMEHELVIIKTDTAPDQLPMDESGSEVDEAAAGNAKGEVENVSPGGSKSGTFDLDAGKYVLICNVPGHYKAGMHVAFDVM